MKKFAYLLISIVLGFACIPLSFGQTYEMPTGSNVSSFINTCGGIFTDNNGAGSDYSNNQKAKLIVCPTEADKVIQVNFNSFNIEAGFDSLVIVNRDNYTGRSFTEPNIIDVYWGTDNPGTITSTHSSGCLTFYFSSDGSINDDGWTATFSCVDPIYPMPTGNNVQASVTTCSGSFSDDGGSGSKYSNNQKSKLIVCPDQPDKVMQVNFSSFSIEAGFDSLVIVNRDNYTGRSFTEPNVIGVFWGTDNPGTITSTHSSGCLTFYFSSDGSINDDGWTATFSCVDPIYPMPTGNNVQASVTTCSGPFTDDGGSGSNYSNNQKSKLIICPDEADKAIQVNFSSFDIEAGFDSLVIVNRDNYTGQAFTEPNIVGVFWGTDNPGTITSTHSSGCLTFYFSSDGSINEPGWEATISCVDACALPVAQCQSTTVELDGDGTGSLLPAEIDNGSTADCGLLEMTVAPNSFDCSDLGNQMVTLTVTDINGESSSCSTTVTVVKGTGLPSGWQHTDIDQANGDAVYDPCEEVFTINSSGYSNFFGDEQHFAYQEICGDVEIIAHISNIDNPGYAGIQIRESLAPNAKMAGLKSQLSTFVHRVVRTTTGGFPANQQLFKPMHSWLRLVRSGSTFSGYTSIDGVNWSFAFATTMSMNSCAYVGLFTESYNDNAVTTADFDQVSITGGNPMVIIQDPTNNPSSNSRIGETQQPTLGVFPNPVAEEANIIVDIPEKVNVTLELYNLQGRRVSVLESGILDAGRHSYDWKGTIGNGQQLVNGLYLLKLQAKEAVITRKIILQR